MNSDSVKRYFPWVVAVPLFLVQLDSTIVNACISPLAASLGTTLRSPKAVSSLTFRALRADDGQSVTRGGAAVPIQG